MGFAVFVTNRHRKATQSFLILSIAMICWLACLYFGSTSHDPAIVATNMRVAFAARSPDFVSVKLPPAFDGQAGRDLARSFSSLRGWIILALATIIFCQSDFLVGERASQIDSDAAPQPIYDWGVYLYAYFFTGRLGCSSCRFSARS